MSYLEQLKTEANYTRTLNGAKTHSSTGDACLDFFAVAGGMRYRSPRDQKALFERAYIENPELAMKLAVKGMLPDNTIGRKALTRIRIYRGAEHNQAAQKPEELQIKY